MHGAWATELITRTFVGDESDQFQNLCHRNHGTNGLEINARHWPPLLEPPAQFGPTNLPGYPKSANREEELVLGFLTSGKRGIYR